MYIFTYKHARIYTINRARNVRYLVLAKSEGSGRYCIHTHGEMVSKSDCIYHAPIDLKRYCIRTRGEMFSKLDHSIVSKLS